MGVIFMKKGWVKFLVPDFNKLDYLLRSQGDKLATKGTFNDGLMQIWVFFDPPFPSVMQLCPTPYALLSRKGLPFYPSLSDVIYE